MPRHDLLQGVLRLKSRSLVFWLLAAMAACINSNMATAQVVTVTVPPLAEGLKNPESVVVTSDGRVLVSVIGEFDKDGDGMVAAISPGKVVPLATGMDDPKGLVEWKGWIFVADNKRVWRIDPKGKSEVYAAASDFPRPPVFLNDLAIDENGVLFVSDTGDRKGNDGAVFRITSDKTITTIVDRQKNPEIRGPNGVMIDGPKHLLMADFLAGTVSRVTIADGTMEKLLDGLPGADGLVRDMDGNLYISQWSEGRVSVLPPEAKSVVLISDKFQAAADICLDWPTGHIIVPDMKKGTVTTLSTHSFNPTGIDESPLAVRIEPAFENLEFKRPIVLTHGNDGTNRVYVASELGTVHVFPNDQEVSESKLFFDLHHKVKYNDNENEEGFLGMAFHPRFKDNGEFFVYYNTIESPHLSVISRFRATGPDHNSADASSEEELMRIAQPFWNHKGGTLAFGPDGYLYVGLGDGGAADDPYGNGQNLGTLLGKILRIDVDHQDAGKKYAIPKDNPFVKEAGAKPEIFATGVRNIWRLAFDRTTGVCWAADVGQNLWEEINLITSGGNYGWSQREGMHRFRATGCGPCRDLIEPIWEYHHDIGKSITGGTVYRGKRVPELAGNYVYADYVTGQVWGLAYDAAAKKVVANRPIAGNVMPVMSFGEDEAGEVYFMTPQGRLLRFASK
jgi:glucose/arabinose dehydrogenase